MDPTESAESPSDEIYVLKSGNILGPFTRDRLKAALEAGELTPTDFAQTGGMPIWQPLVRLLGDNEVELRGAIAPDWKSLLRWAWLRLRYDIGEQSEFAGALCLGVGLLVLALSHWTFLFWLPWMGGALLAAIALLQRRRFVAGVLLLLGVILLPLGVFIWHARLAPAPALPFEPSKVEPSPEPQQQIEETPATTAPVEAKPEVEAPLPAPSVPVAPPVRVPSGAPDR